MRKNIMAMVMLIFLAGSISSCATVFGGKVTDCQRTKPGPGEKERPVRVVALIADIVLFWPGLIVDFATGAIYQPCK